MIGTSVNWFPGSAKTGIIGLTAEADTDIFQDDRLIGKNLLSIARSNECLTDFSGYPDFDFNTVTGEVTGFPVSAGELLVISYSII